MLDQILRQVPVERAEPQTEAELEPLIAMGEQILGEDPARAVSIVDELTGMAPDHPAVVSGRLRALIALDRDDEAEAAIAALPEEIAGLPEIERAKSALALKQDAAPVEDFSGLQAEVAVNPQDLDARYRLAGGQLAAGDRAGAAEIGRAHV